MTHESELLWRRQHEVAPYPPGVRPITEMIQGTAFFPGGRGIWQWDTDALPALPVGGIMVLGHDFHSETEYRASVARGYESRSQPTWRGILQLLQAARIHPLHCFFTNVYVGLRQGDATTGRFPGAADPAFVQRCLSFLRVQLGVFRPQIVLTLGVYVPPLLARLSTDLEEWRTAASFRELDARRPFRPVASLDAESGIVRSAVATLTHPSQRRLNVGRRKYLDLTGEAAELQLLRDACATLPINSSPHAV